VGCADVALDRLTRPLPRPGNSVWGPPWHFRSGDPGIGQISAGTPESAPASVLGISHISAPVSILGPPESAACVPGAVRPWRLSFSEKDFGNPGGWFRRSRVRSEVPGSSPGVLGAGAWNHRGGIPGPVSKSQDQPSGRAFTVICLAPPLPLTGVINYSLWARPQSK
jgi:hypothetical protein